MRIVLDTNVLVSGLLNPHGPSGRIVQMVAAGALRLCFDARIICEYREVLARPAFAFKAEHIEALLEQIRTAGESVSARPLADALPDPDDEPFLEVAMAAGVEYLVTGNIRHFPIDITGGPRVVSPREFLHVCRPDA